MKASESRWITYRQAQDAANLSRGTLWKLVRSGRIPAAKVGRRVLIDREGLDRFLDGLARGGTDPF